MASPFERVLVPYDGSEPADAALAFATALGRAGSALDILHVLDETEIVAQSSASIGAFDPTQFLETLEEQVRTMLADAGERTRAGGVAVTTTLLFEPAVAGITRFADEHADGLIAMGTHARGGLPRVLLGSVAEGVLRSASVPVLVVRAEMQPSPAGLFRKLLVAVDHSDPADAAVRLAGRLQSAFAGACVLCSVVDPHAIEAHANRYGYGRETLVAELHAEARATLERALARGGFTATTETAVVEGEPGPAILAQAHAIGADAIVMGSHGRRGIRRLLLGSVAEHVVHESTVPVVVVRQIAGS